MRASRYKLSLSKLITRYWPLVIGGWIALAILLRTIAPAWNDIAADGDLAFLPPTVPSAVGQRELTRAFPSMGSRSAMVMVIANDQASLSAGDQALAMEVARRLHWAAARNLWTKLQTPLTQSPLDPQAVNPKAADPEANVAAQNAIDNLNEAIEIEEILGRYLQSVTPNADFLRLPDAYQLRGQLLRDYGEASDQAQAALDLDTAALMREQHTLVLADELPAWAKNIQDVWSWRHPVVGHKLGSNEARARLINVQLGSDFTAVDNIATFSGLEQLVLKLRQQYEPLISPGTRIEWSGSAAVGADMLRAAASGVKMTESITVLLVLLILAVVYRAPILIAIPLASIGLSLMVATNLIALLARDPATHSGYGLSVFTTTRIFVVVLLFGAGTDFCMFLLARSRELLQVRSVGSRRAWQRLVGRSWLSVHDALVASALTTVVGLALMWFSHFEKFQYSGPIIAISLLVTLCVCLTFTPALLSGIGQVAFWPRRPNGHETGSSSSTHNLALDQSAADDSGYWAKLAGWVVARPAAALIVTLLLLAIPAGYGLTRLGHVTYDLTEELSASAPSRRGARLIAQYFPTQDGSPLKVLLIRDEPFASDDQLQEACNSISAVLYVDGVDSVRGLTDPLGDYPPGKRMGLFDKDAWRRRVLNRIARERYVSNVDTMQLRVARFDVVLSDNPFSLAAGATLKRIQAALAQELNRPQSAWHGAQLTTTGTTVGITDLRQITQADQRRIQILVTIGVWLVLMIMLRQWVLSTYLIFTVLLSYFATLGITYATFAALYAPDYSGLDWKVPLFLFVILVAVGQDYNVYLVTRIFEEQRRLSKAGEVRREAVRRALQMTGGIITSCGFVMAGTFIAMTGPAVLLWLSPSLPAGWVDPNTPVLRGMTELGFALALGVLLDTLIVRTILVPAFMVLRTGRWKDG